MNRYGWLGLLAAVSVALAAQAMPSRNDLKKVSPTVNELMSGDMKAVKAGELKQKEAADHAVGYAREATDEASKFLFYKGAFGLYVKGRAYSDALRTLELLKAEVKDVPDKVLLEIIGGKLKDVPKEDGGALVALYESLDRKLRCQTDIARLEGSLKINPKDAEARRQLAVRRAQLGDWPAALKDFVQLEGAEAKLAKTEQAGEVKTAADGWWELAANAEEEEQTLFRRHAADLYRRAIAKGKVTGIQKSLAQKRADEYPAEGAAVAAAPASAATECGGQDSARPTVAASDAPKAVVKSGKGITLKLKKGVPLEFVHCPAGTYTKGLSYKEPSFGMHMMESPHKVRISRPFFMTRTPVTIEQYHMDTAGRIQPYEIGGGMGDLQFPEFGFKSGKTAIIVNGRNSNTEITPSQVGAWVADLAKRFARELPRGYVVRLPTEAEYEYAARAGSDDVDDLFVKTELTQDEAAQLCVTREELKTICEKHRVWGGGVRNMCWNGGYPSPVASRKANAWGIHDGWWYFSRVLVADRWTPGRIFPYWIAAADVPEIEKVVVDPILSVIDGQTAGNIAFGCGKCEGHRGDRYLALDCDRKTKTFRPGYFGSKPTGFFLAIAPDVSTLTAITPPKE